MVAKPLTNAAISKMIPCREITTWNHIKDKSSRYQNLTLDLKAYRFLQDKDHCEKTNNISGILVKNLIDWQEQHSNGIEVNLSPYQLTFSSLQNLSFDIALDYAKTRLISEQQLLRLISMLNLSDNATVLNALIESESMLKMLVDNFAHINIVFYGENHQDASQRTLYASYPIKFSSNIRNQWKPIAISAAELSFYFEKNYQETAAEYELIKEQPIVGMLIMAESANHKVLRNYAPLLKLRNADMLFNEVAFKITNLSMNHK